MKRLTDKKDEDKKEKEFLSGSRDRAMFEDVSDNVSRNNSTSEIKDANTNDGKNVSSDVSIDGNIEVIKPSRDEGLERVSFYMKPSTYKKLKKVARQSDMGISEFHQKLLENILDKIIIKE